MRCCTTPGPAIIIAVLAVQKKLEAASIMAVKAVGRSK